MDCVFCQISRGELPAAKLYEDDQVLAFSDLRPVAPTHILIIPRRHVESLAHATSDDWPAVIKALQVAQQLAQEGDLQNGYRIVANVGENGGQTVGHLHWHLIGGRAMAWPPG
jgi:histidine triad (HIT) family protein